MRHWLGRALLAVTAVLSVSILWPQAAHSAGPRALSKGQLPEDARLKPLKDYNGHFPFTPDKTRQDWAQRAGELRRRMLVSQGLWPMPAKTPLGAVIHGKIDRGDYTVEKAYFESYPGFYVTGNLYRPKGPGGKRPGVLCPHGHWRDGRFHDKGRQAVREEIVQGAERFEEGGRSPLQARCVQMARMGCVVFLYDMIGYADSVQISYQLAHRMKTMRPEMNTPDSWGLFSAQAEAHLQNVMGMQTYSSLRAVDFLLQLPDVDPQRIAVTGASGGGTQTLLLAALDPRIAVSIPAVMTSTSMQGGCTCENSCLLRIGRSGNVQFSALFAPKPQLLIAANDWTRELARKGFPELKQHYQLHGAEANVALSAPVHFDHNYNYVNRSAMYSWLNKHFQLGLKEPVVEEDYTRLSTEEMSVWDQQHPKPAGGVQYERKLLRWMTEDAQKQIAALTPHDEGSLNRYREVVGGAVDVLIGRGLSDPSAVRVDLNDGGKKDGFTQAVGFLRYTGRQDYLEELPVVYLHPTSWNRRVAIWIDGQGKSALLDEDGSPRPAIRSLLEAGISVLSADLLYQGEFLADGKPTAKTRRVENPREFAGFTFGYNHTLFSRRVHDILSIVTFAKNHESSPEEIMLVGLSGAGPWVAAAGAQAREAVDRLAVDTGGFRFGKLTDWQDVNFLPGGAKYGDLPGMLALAAPRKMWLAGEGKQAPPLVQAAYRAAGKPDRIETFDGKPEEAAAAAVKWLTGGK